MEPMWASCWPHELCYLAEYYLFTSKYKAKTGVCFIRDNRVRVHEWLTNSGRVIIYQTHSMACSAPRCYLNRCWFIFNCTFENKQKYNLKLQTFSSVFHGKMLVTISLAKWCLYDDVIKWKHFPCYWPSVRVIHRSPVNSPHKGQGRGSLMFSLISVWTTVD